MAKVIINETHDLLDEQVDILNEEFPGGWERLDVPERGWNLAEIKGLIEVLGMEQVVFCSPVPALLCLLAGQRAGVGVICFHNDNRVAKELPNGKIIHTVAPTGWQLV